MLGNFPLVVWVFWWENTLLCRISIRRSAVPVLVGIYLFITLGNRLNACHGCVISDCKGKQFLKMRPFYNMFPGFNDMIAFYTFRKPFIFN